MARSSSPRVNKSHNLRGAGCQEEIGVKTEYAEQRGEGERDKIVCLSRSKASPAIPPLKKRRRGAPGDCTGRRGESVKPSSSLIAFSSTRRPLGKIVLQRLGKPDRQFPLDAGFLETEGRWTGLPLAHVVACPCCSLPLDH